MPKKKAPLKLAERVDTWYAAWCPHCKERNWVCNGDVSDITGWDIDGVKCWACKKEFILSDLDVVDVRGDGGLNIEVGLKSPT